MYFIKYEFDHFEAKSANPETFADFPVKKVPSGSGSGNIIPNPDLIWQKTMESDRLWAVFRNQIRLGPGSNGSADQDPGRPKLSKKKENGIKFVFEELSVRLEAPPWAWMSSEAWCRGWRRNTTVLDQNNFLCLKKLWSGSLSGSVLDPDSATVWTLVVSTEVW
jgi:hypothetical protein